MKLVNEINKNKEKSNSSDLNSITNFIENQFYYHISNIDQRLVDFFFFYNLIINNIIYNLYFNLN